MRNKPKITITDKKKNIVYSVEYLNLTKAKQALLDNGYILKKRVKPTSEEKDISKQVNERLLTTLIYKKENKYFAELTF